MALNLVSPGVKVREVDLTIGRIDDINDQVGAIAGPFAKGPVGVPVLIETEQDLLNTFGKPYSADGQYEYWHTASSYLSYGGVLRVIRTDGGSGLVNANAPTAAAVTNLKILSQEDYYTNHTVSDDWHYAARNPGSWANNLRVCVIDSLADQRLAIGTDGLSVGYAITAGFSTSVAKSDGTVGVETGFLKGMITQINEGSIDVKLTSIYDNATTTWSKVAYEEGSVTKAFQGYDANLFVGISTLTSENFANRYRIYNDAGTEQQIERYRFGGSVGSGSSIVSFDSFDSRYVTFGDTLKSLNGTLTATVVGFTTASNPGVILNQTAGVGMANTTFIIKSGIGSGLTLSNVNTATDWYNQQTLGLTNSTVYWKSIADRPKTSEYTADRMGEHDEIHVAIVDDNGDITGSSGNIIEKWTNLSKAADAKVSPSTAVYYKDYVAQFSEYIFVGAAHTGTGTKFTSMGGYTVDSTGAWGGNAQSTTFNAIGSKSWSLASGSDYGGVDRFNVELGDVVGGYSVLENPAEYSVNFLINGPSGGASIYESQAKASKLIQIAETRKDCIACISPHRSSVVNVTSSDAQTSGIIQFYDALPSSSYAVFDSGYKYMYDRFNNSFRYIPLNGDVAGLMARTSINSFPWFSPAGATRGTINNAIKLAYNPSQAQRDLLYPKRVNPVMFSPGAGMVLFGDKTALKVASAFDRINVRRLFLTIESTIERAAKAQLFEFNDVLTRTNFLNIVEPYLRDVKAKRGISDFVVICDETNNTPDVIDANQFKADIFVKPARSINFIGLTFVATRSGISFDEVIGAV